MNSNILRNLRLQTIFNPQLWGQDPGSASIPQFSPDGETQGLDPTQLPGQMQLPPPQSSIIPIPQQQPGGPSDMNGWLSSLYHPEHSASDRMTQLMNSYPQRTDPHGVGGFLGKLAAVAGGITGGQPLFDETLHGDFIDKLKDWNNQIGPAERMAGIERQSNSNERQLAMGIANQNLKEKDLERKTVADKEKIDNAKARTTAYVYHQMHPNEDIQAPKGGFYISVNPITHQVTTLKDENGDPIPTGKADEEFLATLKGQQAQERVNTLVSGANNRTEQTNATKGWQLGEIADPNDPNKKIPVRFNLDTGALERAPAGFTLTPKPTAAGVGTSSGMQNIQQKAQDTLNVLNEIIDEKGNLRPEIKMAVGKSRMTGISAIPGTDAHSADLTIKRLKDMLTLELLSEMKSESKNGTTGFGRLTNMEVGILSSAASKIDPSLQEEQFVAEAKRIREKLMKIMQPADGLNPVTTIKKPTALDYIKKYGRTDYNKENE